MTDQRVCAGSSPVAQACTCFVRGQAHRRAWAEHIRCGARAAVVPRVKYAAARRHF
jgi:hypothetical protein